MKYVSRPTEVEAKRWSGKVEHTDFQIPGCPANEITKWVEANGGEARYYADERTAFDGPTIAVRTVNGWAYAVPGHYVVQGTATFCVHGDDHDGFCRRDFYPCDPETFESRWSPVPA